MAGRLSMRKVQQERARTRSWHTLQKLKVRQHIWKKYEDNLCEVARGTQSVTLRTGVGSNLELASAKVVLLTLI